jgi:beta-glucosidase
MHHLLLGHGLALAALRRNDPGSQKGIVVNVGRGTTDGATLADVRAAELFELQHNDWVLDPLLRGQYPALLHEELWPAARPPVQDGDLAIIAAPLDFLGINYYFRTNVRTDGQGGYMEVPLAGVERTQMGWEVYPDGLRDLLIGFQRRYANLPPVYITENGMASDDRVVDGAVVDEQRIAYLNRHLAAVDLAVKAGVDVRGYYVWSLLDNFEWAYGYERRFGIVHVDYATQRRTPKRSAQLNRDLLARRRAGSCADHLS